MTPSDYLYVAALDHQSDEAVVSALRQGQIQALDVVFQRYGIKVYSLAYKILADAEEAEAMTRNVFTALWKTDFWQPEQEPLDSFLVTLTRSRSLLQVEHRGWGYAIAKQFSGWFPSRSQHVSLTTSQSDVETWHLEHTDDSVAAEQLLGHLSRKERDILGVAYYEATHLKALSKRLHIPPKIALHRSRKALIKLHRTRLA